MCGKNKMALIDVLSASPKVDLVFQLLELSLSLRDRLYPPGITRLRETRTKKKRRGGGESKKWACN